MSLWTQVTEATSFDPAGYFILAEACRTADIIERLSGALASGSSTWISLADEAVEMADGVEIHIVVNPLLGEIRQQRGALKALLAQLKLGVTQAGAAEKSAVDKLIESFSLPK